MKRLIIAVLAGGMGSLQGCATIVTGNDQNVTFQSEPEAATVSVDGKVLGKTPLTTKIERKTKRTVTIEKDGFKSFSSPMGTTLNSWFLGNIILGGFFGTTTDAASGSIHEYSPDQYFARLVPEAAPYGLQDNQAGDIKRLVIAFGPEIRLELAGQGGENVDELMSALGVRAEHRKTAFGAMRNLANSTPDDFEFAKKLVEVFEVPPAGMPAAAEREAEPEAEPEAPDTPSTRSRRPPL